MNTNKAVEMIDEYLLEPNSIAKDWIECLRLCRQALLDKEALINGQESLMKCISKKKETIAELEAEVERWKNALTKGCVLSRCLNKEMLRTEAIKEFAEKITEIFMRYAHIHSYAEGARKDYIEAVDGTEIEMQSVWDVITLQKNGMAEYEEMSRLQKNIETIEKERLLTELEKDFRLLVEIMTPRADTSVSLVDGHIESDKASRKAFWEDTN